VICRVCPDGAVGSEGAQRTLAREVLSLFIAPNILNNLVKKQRRVFRKTTEFRSLENFQFAVALVRNGRIGQLHTIRTAVPRNDIGCPPQPDMPVPPPIELRALGFTDIQDIPEVLPELESRSLKILSLSVAEHINGEKQSYDWVLPQVIRQLRGRYGDLAH
jgi:hypothetical protein